MEQHHAIEAEPTTVGELAARGLHRAARFLDAERAHDIANADALQDMAQACRDIADDVASRPLASIRQSLHPDQLGGRLEFQSERTVSLAFAANTLLKDVAQRMRQAPTTDGTAANLLIEGAIELEFVARLVADAPQAMLGPRLQELRPYLRHLQSGQDQLTRFPGCVQDFEFLHQNIPALLANPVFLTIARDCYRIRVGRELDEAPLQLREVWASKLASAWQDRQGAQKPLTADAIERIDYATKHPRTPWVSQPFMSGTWHVLAPADASAVLQLIGRAHLVGNRVTPFPLAHACDRVRTRKLACYGGALLIEVQGMTLSGRTGIVSFLLADDGVHLIDGQSLWLHERNELFGPGLDSDDAWLDYLRLFASHVHSGSDAFWPVETPDSLLDRALDQDSAQAQLSPSARTIAPCGFDGEGRRLFEAVICHERQLFGAVFAITADGLIEMIDDTQLAIDLPLRATRWDGPFLTLDPE